MQSRTDLYCLVVIIHTIYAKQSIVNLYGDEGSNLLLTCKLHSVPVTTVVWIKGRVDVGLLLEFAESDRFEDVVKSKHIPAVTRNGFSGDSTSKFSSNAIRLDNHNRSYTHNNADSATSTEYVTNKYPDYFHNIIAIYKRKAYKKSRRNTATKSGVTIYGQRWQGDVILTHGGDFTNITLTLALSRDNGIITCVAFCEDCGDADDDDDDDDVAIYQVYHVHVRKFATDDSEYMDGAVLAGAIIAGLVVLTASIMIAFCIYLKCSCLKKSDSRHLYAAHYTADTHVPHDTRNTTTGQSPHGSNTTSTHQALPTHYPTPTHPAITTPHIYDTIPDTPYSDTYHGYVLPDIYETEAENPENETESTDVESTSTIQAIRPSDNNEQCETTSLINIRAEEDSNSNNFDTFQRRKADVVVDYENPDLAVSLADTDHVIPHETEEGYMILEDDEAYEENLMSHKLSDKCVNLFAYKSVP